MVFLTVANLVRARGPDKFWNRRRTMFLSAAFKGRKRNCYSIAIRSVHRALQYIRLSRPLKKQDMGELWEARITAGCEEHGLGYRWFHEGLQKAGVYLNRKVLADLAAWEPRTFQSLTSIAWNTVKQDPGPAKKGIQGLPSPPPNCHIKGILE